LVFASYLIHTFLSAQAFYMLLIGLFAWKHQSLLAAWTCIKNCLGVPCANTRLFTLHYQTEWASWCWSYYLLSCLLNHIPFGCVLNGRFTLSQFPFTLLAFKSIRDCLLGTHSPQGCSETCIN
jgi:hypothetical protein